MFDDDDPGWGVPVSEERVVDAVGEPVGIVLVTLGEVRRLHFRIIPNDCASALMNSRCVWSS